MHPTGTGSLLNTATFLCVTISGYWLTPRNSDDSEPPQVWPDMIWCLALRMHLSHRASAGARWCVIACTLAWMCICEWVSMRDTRAAKGSIAASAWQHRTIEVKWINAALCFCRSHLCGNEFSRINQSTAISPLLCLFNNSCAQLHLYIFSFTSWKLL